MWSSKGQLEPLVENYRLATFALQTAQSMAGKKIKGKMLSIIERMNQSNSQTTNFIVLQVEKLKR
jgi:hypothetical protein